MSERQVRYLPEIGLLSSPEAVAETIRRSDVPRKAIASEWGLASQSYIDKLCQPGRSISLDRALSLQEITGQDFIAHWFAARSGGVFLPDPQVCEAPLHTAPLDLGESITQFGEFITACAESLADGTLTGAERAKILTESDDALRAIYRIRLKAKGD